MMCTVIGMTSTGTHRITHVVTLSDGTTATRSSKLRASVAQKYDFVLEIQDKYQRTYALSWHQSEEAAIKAMTRATNSGHYFFPRVQEVVAYAYSSPEGKAARAKEKEDGVK